MTQPGWYPDPAGRPQTYRYWDGASWSDTTTGDPYAPPPVQHPAPYAGLPTPAPGPGGSSGLVVALVVGIVVLLAGLGVGGFLGFRALTDDDREASGTDTTVTATADRTAPTDATDATDGTDTTDGTDSTDATGTIAPPTHTQCNGGVPAPHSEPGPGDEVVSGGPLSLPVPNGYAPETRYATAFAFADDFVPVQKTIETGDRYSWVSVYGVGALHRDNGFDDPAQAAEAVMACMARSEELYQHFERRVDLTSGAVTVDGHDGFQVTAELRVDDPDLSLAGDVAQVVVVDTGDPAAFGLYLSVVPIGDAEAVRQQQRMVGRIQVG